MIFTAVVAIATVVYAILAWKLVSETRTMREVQTEPKVSAILQPREDWINFVDLIIQNIGLGPAYNVKFEVNPDFEDIGGKLSDIGFIKNGLNYMAPNQKIQLFLSNLAGHEEKMKESFKLRIVYQNGTGKSYSDTYLIDFSQLIGIMQLGEPPLYTIAKNVERIQGDIHQVSSGFKKLNVIMYTKNEIEDMENKRWKELQRQMKKQN